MALITCYKPENKRLLNCSGVFYEEETRLHPDNPQFWIAIAVYAGLVIFAGTDFCILIPWKVSVNVCKVKEIKLLTDQLLFHVI